MDMLLDAVGLGLGGTFLGGKGKGWGVEGVARCRVGGGQLERVGPLSFSGFL